MHQTPDINTTQSWKEPFSTLFHSCKAKQTLIYEGIKSSDVIMAPLQVINQIFQQNK